MIRPVTLAAGVLALAACASPPLTQDEIQGRLEAGIRVAKRKLEAGEPPEASILLNAVARIDPQFAGAPELRAQLGPDADLFEEKGWLGINRRRRVRVDHGLLLPVILWLPNRAFDLLDVLTFDLHVGLGAFADLHATRAAQAAAGIRGTFGAGVYDQRIVGVGTDAESGVSALFFGLGTVSGSALGVPGGASGGADTIVGVHRPSGGIYQTHRDYWAVGATATAGLVGFDVDLHPLQLIDFALGLLFVDFARDDLGTTRGMDFDRLEWELLRSLKEIESQKLWQRREQEQAEAN